MSLIEALLFVSGEKMSVGKLSKITGVKNGDIEKALFQLQLRLKQDKQGIQLLKFGNKVQLVAANEWSAFVGKIIKEALHDDLTSAALETLAIVAYASPITKLAVDNIRGVDSSFTLRSLIVRGLIERMRIKGGREQYRYKPSLDFFKHLGLSKQEDLPDYEKYYQFIEGQV